MQVMFQCNKQAFDLFPNDTRYRVLPVYTTPIVTQCFNGTCYSTGGSISGGGLQSYDNNQDVRMAYQEMCRARHGWLEVELPFCAKSKIPEGFLEKFEFKNKNGALQKNVYPTTPKPDWVTPTEGSCVVKGAVGAWLLPEEQI